MTTPRNAGKDALVLSGGGAKGAYEIGVMKALAEGRSSSTGFQPLTVEVLTGTSVGAYNASFLASRPESSLEESVGLLEPIWRQRIANTPLGCGSGAFRLRDAPLNALDPGCALRPFQVLEQTVKDAGFWARYLAVRGAAFLSSAEPLEARILDTVNVASAFSVEPLYELIFETVDPNGLLASTKSLTIAATNWLEGTLSLFSGQDLAEKVGLMGIAASAAIPGIFPPVEIGGIPFHDGGVLLNTPLKPAIKAGADVLHVIYLDPEVADIALNPIPNTIDTVYRMYLITSAALVNGDIEQARSILRELERHRDLGILNEDMTEILAGVAAGANSRVLQRLAEGRPYRPLTIHRYRPATDFGGGAALLDFSASFIGELIDTGYRDTLRHDCGESNCILPRRS